ncbi:hypothetical protein Taro_020010 [Colocasia esculenta]|uniref:Uncharacterized protein n=1 Tax=Colocasia esculenta TaxID=4460 RepID=A0A843V784_COLES|nr:hypothetical protein [Colocasia esculenta]
MAGGADGDDINVAMSSTKKLGPNPDILPKQLHLVNGKKPMYIGLGFFTSPSPRSLPLTTSFFEISLDSNWSPSQGPIERERERKERGVDLKKKKVA